MKIIGSVEDYKELRSILPKRSIPPVEYEYDFVLVRQSNKTSDSLSIPNEGGTFYWDANSKEAENGGTILKPDSTSPRDKGRWKRQFDGAVSVKWFSAKGDRKTGVCVKDGTFTPYTLRTTVFNEPGVIFTKADEGKSISIRLKSGLIFETTIVTFRNCTHVDLAKEVPDDTVGSEFAWGTDDTQAIQAAFNTKYNVHIPTGNYYITKALKFYDSQQIYGDGMVLKGYGTTITRHGALPVFQAATKDTATTNFVCIHDLSIWNNNENKNVSTIAIDYTHVSYSQIMRVELHNHEKGILGTDPQVLGLDPTKQVHGGYYNEIISPEITSCTIGIHLIDGGNAWHIYGGRFHSNLIGIYVSRASGNHISSAFEHNHLGIEFAPGALKCSVTSSYFEENVEKPELGHPTGAIHFDSGATFNTESGNLFANEGDMIVDNDGSNISLSPLVVSTPSISTGIGSGLNLIPNGSFEADTNSDGLADYWVMHPNIPDGTILSLDSDYLKFGEASKKFRGNSQHLMILAKGTSKRDLQLIMPVVIGERYVFSGWTYVDNAGMFKLCIGNSVDDDPPAYKSSGYLSSTHFWQFHRISFVPSGPQITIYVKENETKLGKDSDRSIWLDDFKLECGILPTAFHHEVI